MTDRSPPVPPSGPGLRRSLSGRQEGGVWPRRRMDGRSGSSRPGGSRSRWHAKLVAQHGSGNPSSTLNDLRETARVGGTGGGLIQWPVPPPIPRTPRLPAHRHPGGLRGDERRRAGGPDADLAREGPDGPVRSASASARCIGAVMEWAIAMNLRSANPCDRLGPGARQAERGRESQAGAAASARGGSGRDGAGVERGRGREAGVRVPWSWRWRGGPRYAVHHGTRWTRRPTCGPFRRRG